MSGPFSAPLALLWICACSDQSILDHGETTGVRGVPDLAVWPEVLVFETAEVGGQTQTDWLTVENVGEELLAIDALDVTGSLAFSLEFEPFALEPGTQHDVPVHFAPTAPQNAGVIWVESNDPDAGRVTVELEGAGLTAALEVDPLLYDFGDATLGCETEGWITLRSTGGVPVTIEELTLVGERFTLDQALPLQLDGYDEVDVRVTFHPELAAAHEGDLYVTHSAGPAIASHLEGQGAPIRDIEEVFWQGPFATTDVLIHVDRSCSMDDDAANLAANFSTFVDTLEALDTDWRVGVLTADDGCHNDEPFDADTERLESRFLAAVQAPGGAYTEAGLYVVRNGMEASCNAALMRDGARTAVLYLSDEPDQSPGRWDDYLADMWKVRPNVVTHAIVLPGDSDGYDEISSATGGLVLDIESAWGGDLADIAVTSVGERLDRFDLQEAADPGSVTVQVDGAYVGGWALASDARAIEFDPGAVPESGAEIRVEYTAGDTCSW